MASPSATPRNKPLTSCATWAVMLVLPRRVDELLGDVVYDARSVRGDRIYKKDLIAALLMLKAPEHPDALAQLFWDYTSSTRFGTSPMLLAKVNLTAALPPPVTHRLDLLVAGAREAKASRVLRRDIVAALVTLHAPETAAQGYGLYREYLDCTAEDASVSGRPLKTVLSLKRPPTGRRPAS